MVYNDAISVNAKWGRIDNSAIVGCLDAYVLGDSEIISQVDLLIDLLPLIDIVPHVRKRCFSLRMRLASKRLREQESVSGLEAKLRQRFVIGSAHLVIDLYKTCDRIT